MHLLHSVGGGSKVRGTCAGGTITLSVFVGAGGGGGLFVVVVVGRKRFDAAPVGGVVRLESRIPSYNIK
jgi:hypothetical protein